MDLFGFDISTITIVTSSGIAVVSLITNIFQLKQNRRNKKLLNDAEEWKNIDSIQKIFNDLIEDVRFGQKSFSEIFRLQIKYCNHNIEDFIKFIKNETTD